MKKVTVQKSAIHGRGMFVSSAVKRGHRIAFLKGSIRKKHNKNKADALAHQCWVGIEKDTWIDPIPPFRFINHSCNPSAGIQGKVTIVALRDLSPGDEVTIDYSAVEGDPRWSLRCRCGEKNCRKIVRSVEYLPESTFKKYLPFVPTYFKKLYTVRIQDSEKKR